MSVPVKGIVAGAALIVVLVALGLLVAQTFGIGRQPTATGIVVQVDSTSAVDISGFTLRAEDGGLTQYRIGPLESDAPAFPAVHLRAHLTSLIPIVVTYHLEDGQRVATRLEDAPLPSQPS